MQRVHNGYVSQGWILLINPTGYIVPPAPLCPGHSFPWTLRFIVPVVSLPAIPRPSILRFHRHERYPFVGMSCVVEYRALLVCVVIISLSLCALAPKAVPVCSPARLVSFVWKRTTSWRYHSEKARQSGTCSGELPWDDYQAPRFLAGDAK